MSLVFRERREQKQDLNDWLKGQQSTSNFYLIECVCVCVSKGNTQLPIFT